MPKVIGIVGSVTRGSLSDFTRIDEETGRQYSEGDTLCTCGPKKGAARFAIIISHARKVPVEVCYKEPLSIVQKAAVLIAALNGQKDQATEVVEKFKKDKPQGILILV